MVDQLIVDQLTKEDRILLRKARHRDKRLAVKYNGDCAVMGHVYLIKMFDNALWLWEWDFPKENWIPLFPVEKHLPKGKFLRQEIARCVRNCGGKTWTLR